MMDITSNTNVNDSTIDDIAIAETTCTDDICNTYNEVDALQTTFNLNNTILNNTHKSLLNSSLDLLDSTYLRSTNLTFNVITTLNNKTPTNLTNADSMCDVTVWAKHNFKKEEDIAENKLKDQEKFQLKWSREPLNLNEYPLNKDSNPQFITKKLNNINLELIQELCVKYLKPPTPPPPGEIIILKENNLLIAPAPPLVIRQIPPRPHTPKPLVVREAPPQAPKQHGVKLIRISGAHIPPPPRKVVLERIAPLPTKPQSVILEKWLPYSYIKNEERKLLFPNQRECIF